MDTAPSMNQIVDQADQISQTKSIYSASSGEIFWKNFLAGFSRALGGIFIYLIFIGIAINVFLTHALPQIKPLYEEYMKAVQTIGQMKTTMPSAGSDIKQYQQLLKDISPTLSK